MRSTARNIRLLLGTLTGAVLILVPAWSQASAASCDGEHATIVGTAGNDVIYGGGGNDRLVGGPGQDRLIGGPGRDSEHQ